MGILLQNFLIEFVDVGYNNELSNKGFLKYMQETAGIHTDKLRI